MLPLQQSWHVDGSMQNVVKPAQRHRVRPPCRKVCPACLPSSMSLLLAMDLCSAAPCRVHAKLDAPAPCLIPGHSSIVSLAALHPEVSALSLTTHMEALEIDASDDLLSVAEIDAQPKNKGERRVEKKGRSMI